MKTYIIATALASSSIASCYGQKAAISTRKVTGSSYERSINQIQTDKNLSFKLISATGNKRGQTVAVTIMVNNKGANFESYNTRVFEFISDAGETFSCESAVFGSNASRPGLTLFANLYTDVPLKTAYVFKGVLPSVTKIKLLALPYFDRFGAQVGKVEFGDVAVKWQ